MTKKIERNRDTNTASTVADIALNASTSTTIIAANADRIFFSLSNSTSNDVWLKLQSASVDNTKNGIFIPKNSYWEMSTGTIYTGEISAIAEVDSPTINALEY